MELGGRLGFLLEQGRYAELLCLADQPSEGAEALARSVLAKVRCRMEQGYVRAAAEVARSAPAQACAAGDAGAALRLWQGFLSLYDPGNRPFARRVSGFAGHVQGGGHGRQPCP